MCLCYESNNKYAVSEWMHNHSDPRGTTGQRAVLYAVAGLGTLIGLPAIIGGALVTLPFMIPVIGMVYTIDSITNCLNMRRHETRIEADPWYRMVHAAPKMNSAKVWQDRLDAYNQHIRRVLAIHELGQVPMEIWQELCGADALMPTENAELKNILNLVGTDGYTTEVKQRAVELATEHLVNAHAELTNTSMEEAKMVVDEIVVKELYSKSLK